MTIPDALAVAKMTDRELHEAGYAWADRARADALGVLAVAHDSMAGEMNLALASAEMAGHDADALEMDRDHYRGRAIAAEERVVYYVGLARKAEQERDALKAEIDRVAPLLAIHGMGGYTMGEFIPADPTSPLGAACVQFGPVTPPGQRCPFTVSWSRLVDEVNAKAGTE